MLFLDLARCAMTARLLTLLQVMVPPSAVAPNVPKCSHSLWNHTTQRKTESIWVSWAAWYHHCTTGPPCVYGVVLREGWLLCQILTFLLVVSEVTHEPWHVGCPEYSSWVHSWLSGMRWRGMNQRIASILRVSLREMWKNGHERLVNITFHGMFRSKIWMRHQAWWLIPNAELLTPCTNLLGNPSTAKDAERRENGPCGATKAPALSNASPVQGPGRLRKVNTFLRGDIFNYFQVFRKVWDTAPIFVWNSGLWWLRFISSSNVYVYYVYIYIYIHFSEKVCALGV